VGWLIKENRRKKMEMPIYIVQSMGIVSGGMAMVVLWNIMFGSEASRFASFAANFLGLSLIGAGMIKASFGDLGAFYTQYICRIGIVQQVTNAIGQSLAGAANIQGTAYALLLILCLFFVAKVFFGFFSTILGL
jgi:hypothetical protein